MKQIVTSILLFVGGLALGLYTYSVWLDILGSGLMIASILILIAED